MNKVALIYMICDAHAFGLGESVVIAPAIKGGQLTDA